MRNRIIHQSLNAFILLCISAFFVLAVYSAVGQKLLPRLADYRTWLEDYISARIEGDVTIGSLTGSFEIFTPSVHMEALSLQVAGENEPRLAIAAVDAKLDVSASIFKLAPVFSHIRVSGLSVNMPGQDEPSSDNSDSVQSLVETLLLQREVSLDNISIRLQGAQRPVQLQRLNLRGDGRHRLISGSLLVGQEHQINTSFTFYSENSPYDLDEFYARGDMAVPDIALLDWLAQAGIKTPLQPLHTSARLQFEFKDGRARAYLKASSPQIADGDKLNLQAVQLALWLEQSSEHEWELILDKLAYQQQGKPVLISGIRAGVKLGEDGARWHLAMDSVDLPEWHNLIREMPYVPQSALDLLQQLNPRGELYNTRLEFWQGDGSWHVLLNGDAQALQVAAYHGAPAIEGLNGHFTVTESGGELLFDTPSLSVGFGPSLYDAPLTPTTARGRVSWTLSPEQVHLFADHLQLQFPDGRVGGGFQLWLPLDNALPGQLLLNLSIENLAFAGHRYLVPNVAGQGTRNWLASALGKGNIPKGNLLLFTELTEHPHTVTELYLGIEKGELQYLADWPAIHNVAADLWLDNRGLKVAVKQGSSLGGNLYNGAVNMPMAAPLTLYVGLQQNGQAKEVFRYFTESPLQEIVNHGLDQWQLDGQEQLSLALRIPLAGDDKLSVQADTRLQNVKLAMTDVGMTFENLNGDFGFSSARGLYSQKLDARLWQQAMRVQVKSDMEAGMVSEFNFSGALATDGLKDWLKLGFLSPLTGTSPVTGQFVLDTRAGHDSHLDVNTDMQGLVVDLPAPFGKIAAQSRPLNVNVSLAKKQIIRIGYDNALNLALALRKGQLQGGQIFIGNTPAFIPAEPGIEIAGHLNDVDVEAWQAAVQRIMQAMPAKESDPVVAQEVNPAPAAAPVDSPLRHIDISVDRIRYQKYLVENTHFLIDEANANWEITADSPLVKGVIRFPSSGPVSLDLDYLHLPADDTSTATPPASDAPPAAPVDALAGFDPHTLPAVNVKVKEIFLGARNYGQWDVELRSNPQGARLHINNASIKKLNIAGNVDWTLINQVHHSVLSLKLSTKDVGGIQRAWQMKAAIEAEKGQASADVNWQGSPAGFNFATLNGVVDMRMEKGRFADVEGTDALKAFGALNFGTISRRLTLDFSDLYQSGVHFDTVKGKAAIREGVIGIVDTLTMDGPGIKFATSGTINLNNKQLNQELFVTIPVSSTLPLVAILAGLAPPVAASIYVGEKLVGNEIERFTSASYTMTGSWDEPKLEIKRRFDNKIDGKKEKSVWQRVKGVFGAGDD